MIKFKGCLIYNSLIEKSFLWAEIYEEHAVFHLSKTLILGHFNVIIIIIMSRCQHGSPWPSPATDLYRPSLPVGLQGYILYQHRAVVCRFKLVILPFLVHVKGSTGVCHSLVAYFSKCPACLVRLTWIVFVMGGKWPYSCCFVGCCLQENTSKLLIFYLKKKQQKQKNNEKGYGCSLITNRRYSTV